jgi:Pro-kumamolisin, activation domain/Bacterial Ig-like domain (group 3)
MPAIPAPRVSHASSAICLTLLTTVVLAFSLSLPMQGQQSTTMRPLIQQPVDESQLATLKGNTHPLARLEFDLGTAPASLPMQRMLLVLKRSPDQETTLRTLLDNQQSKASSSYHKWLTPEQYGQQFGPTDGDMQTVIAWLQSHGFQVGTTKGRSVLEFSGTAGQVQEAFHTTIHKYIVGAEQHWANASDPMIPTALTPVVAGISSLNNFPRRPMSIVAGTFSREKTTGKITALQPQFTFPSGCTESNSSSDPCFYGLGPYDFATIYDVLPLWNSSVNGTGQTIAIVGETNINIQDVRDFRTMFGLPVNDPQIILNGPDPGIQGDETEADLDVQWSGAVAPNATIDFIVSQSTESTSGIDLSAVYIVENNLAPVMSESYGFCELGLGTAGNQFFNSLWQQAAAQGITVFISAGDNGAAGCDNFDAQSPAPAQFGLQVSGYASTPYNVAVGGTDFNDFSDPGTYWNLTNNSTTQASAKSYIPETTWNSSCTNALFGTVGYSTNAETNCNDSRLTPYFDVPLGGSGGVSNCTTPTGSTATSCAGGYAKPSWQTGSGVPNDGKRDIPDVSLFASNGFLQTFYIVCQSDVAGSCSLSSPYSNFLGVGGTSASSPAFAGIMAMVNQQMATQGLSERQGNANYVFYKLATQQPTAFHDVTSGTIAMPCASGSSNCTTTYGGDQYGVLTGYNAGTGYDLATGLGSVDVNNLVNKWSTIASLPSTTTLSSLTPTTVTHGQPVSFSVTVAPKTGSGTPTGTISLMGGPSNSGQDIAGFNLSGGSVSGSTILLPGGTYSVTAHYPGDSTYEPSDSGPTSVTVNKENSLPQVFLVTFDVGGHIISGNTNMATYGTPYLLRVNVENAAGQTCAPATSGTPACPTGDVTLTNNGNTLDAGTYGLNSYGYAEDLAVQLPGGADSVKAAYAGDNSFNASAVTSTITITRAVSDLNAPSLQNTAVGVAFTANALVQPTSSGVPPTGTVTFYSNGTLLAGTTTYQSGNQIGPPAVAWLSVNFTSSTSAFTNVGNYDITASYSGDGNYTPVTSVPTHVTVQYPSPSISFTPSTLNVNPGDTATLTALVDTTNKTVYPTGTIYFINLLTYAPLAGPVTCTSTKDSSGNYACQASASFAVSAAETVTAQYIGDTNYPFTTAGAAQINVNDFNIGIDSSSIVTVEQGQSQVAQIDIGDLGAFNGTVSNFTCSGLPAEAACSFNPAQVTGQGSTKVTITTTPVGQMRRRAAGVMRGNKWMAFAIFPLFGACLIGISARGGRRKIWLALTLVIVVTTLLSCGGSGGGGSGGGGGGTTPNPVPSITSLTPAQQAAGSVSQTMTINGSGFIGSSAVTYNGTARTATFVNGSQLSISLSANDLASAGTYLVVVTNPSPGGGSSSPANFDVVTGTPTGTTTVTVTASSGALTHSTSFSLIVQ